ncbi:MAG: CAP domain-containing protein [Raineya sp.]
MHKKYLLLFVLFVSATLKLRAQTNEVKTAFDFLNKIRQAPHLYSKEVGINLSGISARQALIWNDTLAKVAQAKAEDMAKRNYFDHTNPEGKGINIMILEAGYQIPPEWTEPKNNNYFESLAAGNTTPKEGIIYLLRDGGVIDHKKAGHRSHLLGIDKFYSNLTDIGIGWAKGGKFGTYLCVIIAKKKW